MITSKRGRSWYDMNILVIQPASYFRDASCRAGPMGLTLINCLNGIGEQMALIHWAAAQSKNNRPGPWVHRRSGRACRAGSVLRAPPATFWNQWMRGVWKVLFVFKWWKPSGVQTIVFLKKWLPSFGLSCVCTVIAARLSLELAKGRLCSEILRRKVF